MTTSQGIIADYILFDSCFSNPAQLTDEPLSVLTADFEARLPEYLRNALHREKSKA